MPFDKVGGLGFRYWLTSWFGKEVVKRYILFRYITKVCFAVELLLPARLSSLDIVLVIIFSLFS